MYDIIASASAKRGLEEIKAYLLTEFRNPQAVAHDLQNWVSYI